MEKHARKLEQGWTRYVGRLLAEAVHDSCLTGGCAHAEGGIRQAKVALEAGPQVANAGRTLGEFRGVVARELDEHEEMAVAVAKEQNIENLETPQQQGIASAGIDAPNNSQFWPQQAANYAHSRW